MSDGTLRKRERLRSEFKSLKSFFQPSKKTKEKNTGNSQTIHTTATSFSASVPAPSDPTPTPSTTLAATAEPSSEARSRGAIRNDSFQPDSESRFGQPPVTATVKHTAHAEVGSKEQHHNSTVTGIDKAQSLWSKAFDSKELDQERKTLKGIGFQANAIDIVSDASSFVQNILNDKQENAWKIEIKGEKIVLRDIAMKLLGWMDRFKEIGDTIVQFDPVHAALPWAVFRFLLKVCMDQQKTMDAILVGLENIAGLIQRCTLYELLYLSEDSSGSKNLEKSMLRLYIAILKFLAKAIDKLKQNHLKSVFTTEDISNYLGDVQNLEKTVGYDADVAKEQCIFPTEQPWNFRQC
ncbi:hypothetical protein FPQ18DRAFT_388611 [Pyronema domesticum]|nr:hypothetical protein FPQ18DRAFT_388611 [Pyronema domesticum]